MFKLSPVPLETLDLKEGFKDARAGGFVAFEGWVRDHNDGKKVTALSYEAYEALCLTEAERIFAEVKARFPVLEARCFHRIGELKVGEMAVWVGVSAPHRDEAFKACRYIIDQIKARLPIWKKEFYHNGDSGWVGCSCVHDHPHKV